MMTEIISQLYYTLENMLENLADTPIFPLILVILVCSMYKFAIGLLTGGGMYSPGAKPLQTDTVTEKPKIDLTKKSDTKQPWEIQIDREVR